MSQQHYDEDDEKEHAGPSKRRTDFDCPGCSANNPHDDGFGDGDEVSCHYCGSEFKVVVTEEGRFRYREM